MGYVDRLVRVERRAYALEDRLNETRKEMHRLNYELTLCRGAIADLAQRLEFVTAPPPTPSTAPSPSLSPKKGRKP
jgi:predicted nuclease with TOPRIM domain